MAAEEFPPAPALIYVGTDGVKYILDGAGLDLSFMPARDRAICQALIDYAGRRLTEHEIAGPMAARPAPGIA